MFALPKLLAYRKLAILKCTLQFKERAKMVVRKLNVIFNDIIDEMHRLERNTS